MLCKHRTYFSSKVSEMIFSGYMQGRAGIEDTSLTPRERETVQLIAEGKSNKEIAEFFGISVKTVETHRAAIMRKLKLDSFAAWYDTRSETGSSRREAPGDRDGRLLPRDRQSPSRRKGTAAAGGRASSAGGRETRKMPAAAGR